jgi:hypothetical protein
MTVSRFVRPLAVLAAMTAAPVLGAEAVLLESVPASVAKQTDGAVRWWTSLDGDGTYVLKAHVEIAEGNLAADLIFRPMRDPTFPSDYVIEVSFAPEEDFAAGSVTELKGVLVRMYEEQGAPVEGATARVIGNSFLFAAEQNGNVDILTTGNWIDFAIIYATGQRAILGLGVDETARDALADMLL